MGTDLKAITCGCLSGFGHAAQSEGEDRSSHRAGATSPVRLGIIRTTRGEAQNQSPEAYWSRRRTDKETSKPIPEIGAGGLPGAAAFRIYGISDAPYPMPALNLYRPRFTSLPLHRRNGKITPRTAS
jgi:hypothetical protein